MRASDVPIVCPLSGNDSNSVVEVVLRLRREVRRQAIAGAAGKAEIVELGSVVTINLTCAELSALYRRGALSPVEVARDLLVRIEKNAHFNAFMPVQSELVIQAAAASEVRWRNNCPLGPLDGIPATVKDNIWLKGYPTRRGSKTTTDSPATMDSPAVARLREKGVVFIGKTCLPEHGWIGVCHSPLTGITRSPWNLNHTPGGSTGGGAVAALLGLGLLHLGTDGAGSLRIPAAFTGVFGMKPSYGQVPSYPPPMMNVLVHQGPITRRVVDAALMLSVIAEPDARDMTAWNSPPPDFTASIGDGARGLRVAVSKQINEFVRPAPDIETAVYKVARVLEGEGAIVEEASPPLAGSDETIRALWWPVMAALAESAGARRNEMDPDLLEIAEFGKGFTAQDFIVAYNRRAEIHAAMMAFHKHYDILLTPTVPLTALEAGLVVPRDGSYGRDWMNWSPYTYPFNITQQPAASVPCGLASNGLPIGVQLVAASRGDDVVLRVAKVIQEAFPMPDPPHI